MNHVTDAFKLKVKDLANKSKKDVINGSTRNVKPMGILILLKNVVTVDQAT